MRKWILTVALLFLLSALAPAALAAPVAAITDAVVEPGETVYLTVSLEGSCLAESVGISFTCDADILTPIYSSCTWAKQGLLQDFGSQKNSGVWAAAEPVELEGTVCTLAFGVRSGVTHFRTTVSCRVVVKNSDGDVVDQTVKATVSAACDHVFGDWKDIGGLGHSRSCSLCGVQQNQPHSYDDVVTVTQPDSGGLESTTYTCSSCGSTWEVTHTPEQEPALPTQPESTLPPEVYPTVPAETTAPPTNKPGPAPETTVPAQQPNDTPPAQTTRPVATEPAGSDLVPTTAPAQGDHDHDHDHTTVPTKDDQDHDHDHDVVPTQDDHDHDHDHTVDPDSFVSAEERTRNILVFLATLGLLALAARMFLKKKRR